MLKTVSQSQPAAKVTQEAARIKSEAEKEAAQIRQQAENIRRQAVNLEVEVDRRLNELRQKKQVVEAKEEELDKQIEQLKETQRQQMAKLEKVAKLTQEKAEKRMLKLVEKRMADKIAKKIREAEEEIKARADEKAKEILVEAMRHGVTDYVAEYTVSSVHLADEEMKGRIIGREGRNIRAFEKATGVEIELDESNDILLSSFDPIRREIARRALNKLVRDKRIQPSRIEELVGKTKKEVEKIMFEEGEKLAHAVGVYRLHPDLLKLLGRFKFRFSYGQNMIAHTLEETKIGVGLAQEMGAKVNVVRLGCLLHDIGKVVTDQEGTHVQIAVNLAKKYQMPSEVIDCIAEHHEDKPFSTVESRIVWVADAISGSRPGARYEPHEEYLQRMTQIEKVASEFEGVKEAFAYQAGRDVRVMVKPEEIGDDQLTILADKIARALEEKASYAGQIKVTCIRETRAAETTKAK
jgi:ribonuclease Y